MIILLTNRFGKKFFQVTLYTENQRELDQYRNEIAKA